MRLSEHALAYLQRPAGGFWAWDEDGRAVSFASGPTIAFRAQFRAVVEHLAGRDVGLPPFTAIVLLLAACRGNWRDVRCERVPADLLDLLHPPMRYGVMKGLDQVAGLPAATRESGRAVAVLAEMLFERGRDTDWEAGESAADVVAALSGDVGLAELVSEREPAGVQQDFRDAAWALAAGFAAFSVERFETRLKTGLDALPGAAAGDEVSLPGRVRVLMEALVGDPELGAVARLAREVLAAVHVPRLAGPREELAAGGVADLSNHGPLDRLVLSELAYDDLTLAVRVATNEAMYLKREPPAGPPPRERVIVLDSGIRMWGTPRVFSTAIGLALAATADRKATVSAFRSAGRGEVRAVELGTRDGLVAHLAELDTSPQPGESLAAVMRRHPGAADFVVVTHADAAADRDFTRAVDRAGDRPWYLATVDREGRFRMEAVSASGRRPVREAVLNLSDLLAGPNLPDRRPVPSPPVDEDLTGLPVIFGVRPFPLRLPYHPLPARSHPTIAGGLVAVTTADQRLLYWPGKGVGPVQLSERVPPGKLLGVWVDEAANVARVVTVHGAGNRPLYQLLSARLDGREESVVPLEHLVDPVQGAALREGMLYHVGNTRVDVFRAADGARMATVQLAEKANWAWGRFIRYGDAYRVIGYNGSQGTVEVPKVTGAAEVLFEIDGADGPLAFLENGTVLSLENAKGYVVPWPDKVPPGHFREHPPVVGPDGRRVAATGPDRARYVLDVGAWERAWRRTDEFPVLAALGPAWQTVVGAPQVKRGMMGYVFRNRAGTLTLGAQREQWSIELEGEDLVLNRNATHHAVGPKCSFRRLKRRRGVAYDLYVATWPNGSKVFLDRRGMIHLKSADPALPEVTLVLAHGSLGTNNPMAGWSSDGKVFGPEYFHGQKVAWVARHFEEHVRRFAEGLA